MFDQIHHPSTIRGWRYVWGSLRVIALLLVLLVLVFAVGVLRSRAEHSEALRGFGAQMLRYEEATHQDAPRALLINGSTLQLTSGTAEHSVDVVLDRYEERCRQRDGRFFEPLKALARHYPVIKDFNPRAFDGTMRGHGPGDGFVACLDMGPDTIGFDEFRERLDRFVANGDTSEVGQLRFVYAEATTLRSGIEGAHFVTVSAEGALPLSEMFPVTGDAPGRDVRGIPRPPASRRILAFKEKGVSQRITMYANASMDTRGFRKFYEQALPRRGWRLLIPKQPWLRGSEEFLAVRQGDRNVMLSFAVDEEGKGLVTVVSEDAD